jgi:hypothetical protein
MRREALARSGRQRRKGPDGKRSDERAEASAASSSHVTSWQTFENRVLENKNVESVNGLESGTYGAAPCSVGAVSTAHIHDVSVSRTFWNSTNPVGEGSRCARCGHASTKSGRVFEGHCIRYSAVVRMRSDSCCLSDTAF